MKFQYQSRAITLLKMSGKFHALATILHTQTFIKIHKFVLNILNGNKILKSLKGHNSFKKERKIICNCPYLHLVNINSFTKVYQNPSTGPQDIAHK